MGSPTVQSGSTMSVPRVNLYWAIVLLLGQFVSGSEQDSGREDLDRINGHLPEIIITVETVGSIDDVTRRASRMADMIRLTLLASQPSLIIPMDEADDGSADDGSGYDGSGPDWNSSITNYPIPSFAAVVYGSTKFGPLNASVLWTFDEWERSSAEDRDRLITDLKNGRSIEKFVIDDSYANPSLALKLIGEQLLKPDLVWEVDQISQSTMRTIQWSGQDDNIVFSNALPIHGRIEIRVHISATIQLSSDTPRSAISFPSTIRLGVYNGASDLAIFYAAVSDIDSLQTDTMAHLISVSDYVESADIENSNFRVYDLNRTHPGQWRFDATVMLTIDTESNRLVRGDRKNNLVKSQYPFRVMYVTTTDETILSSNVTIANENGDPELKSGFKGWSQTRPAVLFESANSRNSQNFSQSSFDEAKLTVSSAGAVIHAVGTFASSLAHLNNRVNQGALVTFEYGGQSIPELSPVVWLCRTGIYRSICSYFAGSCMYIQSKCPSSILSTSTSTAVPQDLNTILHDDEMEPLIEPTVYLTNSFWADEAGVTHRGIDTVDGCDFCPVCIDEMDAPIELTFEWMPRSNSLSYILDRTISVDILEPDGSRRQFIPQLLPNEQFIVRAPFMNYIQIVVGNASQPQSPGAVQLPTSIWPMKCRSDAIGNLNSLKLFDYVNGFRLVGAKTVKLASLIDECKVCQFRDDGTVVHDDAILELSNKEHENATLDPSVTALIVCSILACLSIALVIWSYKKQRALAKGNGEVFITWDVSLLPKGSEFGEAKEIYDSMSLQHPVISATGSPPKAISNIIPPIEASPTSSVDEHISEPSEPDYAVFTEEDGFRKHSPTKQRLEEKPHYVTAITHHSPPKTVIEEPTYFNAQVRKRPVSLAREPPIYDTALFSQKTQYQSQFHLEPTYVTAAILHQTCAPMQEPIYAVGTATKLEEANSAGASKYATFAQDEPDYATAISSNDPLYAHADQDFLRQHSPCDVKSKVNRKRERDKAKAKQRILELLGSSSATNDATEGLIYGYFDQFAGEVDETLVPHERGVFKVDTIESTF